MHEHETDFWTEVINITFDPAHIMAELFWAVIFDVIIITLLLNVVFKKYILPKLRKDIHKEIDDEHGIEHD